MLSTFLRAYPPAQPAPGPAYWFPFRKSTVLVQDTNTNVGAPLAGALSPKQGTHVELIKGNDDIRTILQPREVLYIGALEGTPCLACEVASEMAIPDGWLTLTLRELFGRLDDPAYSIAGYAFQLLYWQQTSRYCPVSGHLTEATVGTWGRHCPHCGHIGYPHVTPAILALVHDGERMLLTHKPGWGKRYSCIAGFVEPGESLEECVQREVLEEVGLEVADVAYVGNQPWPFPHQLMVGFTARYVSGTVKLDQRELDDALWFRPDEPPELPPPLSLAHYIIKTWIASKT